MHIGQLCEYPSNVYSTQSMTIYITSEIASGDNVLLAGRLPRANQRLTHDPLLICYDYNCMQRVHGRTIASYHAYTIIEGTRQWHSRRLYSGCKVCIMTFG